MHGFSTFCAYVRHMPYCANKFWNLNLKRFKPSFSLLLLAYLYEKLKFVKIKQDCLLKFGVFLSELYVHHIGIPLVALVCQLVVLICPFICLLIVLVCPPVVSTCPPVVLVWLFICPLVVLVVLSVSLFITDPYNDNKMIIFMNII